MIRNYKFSCVFCLNMAQFNAISRSRFFNQQKILLKYAGLISILLPNFNPTFTPRNALAGGY